MNTQEMPNARQAYERPLTESIRLHVESVICQSGNGGNAEQSDDNEG